MHSFPHQYTVAARFTGFAIHATLSVPQGIDEDKARQAMHKAEQLCLITNSLNAPVHLDAHIAVLAG